MNILFYLRNNRVNKSGKKSLLIRITIEDQKIPITPDIEVDPKLWDNEQKKMIGKTKEAIQINNQLDDIKVRLRKIHDNLNESGVSTLKKVKSIFTQKDKVATTLVKYYSQRNTIIKELVDVSQKSQDLFDKHERNCERLSEYIKMNYNIDDIDIVDIDIDFIIGYQNYLMITYKCAVNTTAKYMQSFKSVLIAASKKKLISENPFNEYSLKLEKVDKEALTEEELVLISQKTFASVRLERIRDIFLFSCFTGLSYIDVKKLTKENIKTSSNGQSWIYKDRRKTDITSRIPLLEIPKIIIEKYTNESNHEMLLPIISNQKFNEYLKELATVCNIDKHLTFHVARHTFATTVTLEKGISIESISKMLGHTNIRTTQIYAKVTDPKIAHEMGKLADQFSQVESGILGKLKNIKDNSPHADLNDVTRDITLTGINIANQLLTNKMALLNEINESEFINAMVYKGYRMIYFSENLKIVLGKKEIIIGAKSFGKIMGGYFYLRDKEGTEYEEMRFGTIALNKISSIQYLEKSGSKVKNTANTEKLGQIKIGV